MGNTVAYAAEATPAVKPAPKLGKSGKKICCSCPETRKFRDACVVEQGPDAAACKQYIEAHKACLREEGFRV